MATSSEKKRKKKKSLNEPRWRVRAHQHRTMRAEEGEQKKVMGEGERRAGSSNLQGLASNTIWRETIQVCGGQRGRGRGGGGTDEGREQKGQKQVRGHRQRLKPASGVHGARRCRESHRVYTVLLLTLITRC